MQKTPGKGGLRSQRVGQRLVCENSARGSAAAGGCEAAADPPTHTILRAASRGLPLCEVPMSTPPPCLCQPTYESRTADDGAAVAGAQVALLLATSPRPQNKKTTAHTADGGAVVAGAQCGTSHFTSPEPITNHHISTMCIPFTALDKHARTADGGAAVRSAQVVLLLATSPQTKRTEQLTADGGAVVRSAQVVLHISRAHVSVRIIRADLLHGLAPSKLAEHLQITYNRKVCRE